jgi:DNA polymerase-3 subunit epsilon/ATP-dependent DNA helicase DinG
VSAEAAKLSSDIVHQSAEIIAADVEGVHRAIQEMRGRLSAMLDKHSDATIVWVGKDRDGTGTLNFAPLEVGPLLWDDLFSNRSTVIATSATLAAGDGMDYAARRLGLEEPQTLALGSPFDYKTNALLATLTDIPEPGQPGYYEQLADAVAELAIASGGRALALFTSHMALRRTADLAAETLAAEGLTILQQGRDGTPRQLIQRLREDPKTVVFGTASFWEGVDVRGEALSLLIIARLPFAVPTDPIYKARSERTDNPFVDYALPAAILRFRQGFGRLIRDRADRGVVAVLDRRVMEKQYGKKFIASVPECTRIHGHTRLVAAKTAAWLYR